MSDDERFERDLRDVILRDVPAAAPGELRASLHRIPDSRPIYSPRSLWRISGPHVAVGLAGLLLVALIGGLLLSARPTVGPSASQSPTASPNPAAAWRQGPTVANLPSTVSATEHATPLSTAGSSSRPPVSLAPGTFGPTGSMNVGRAGHTATLLKDGRVLIAGGQDASNRYLASAELYDPATGTFSPTGSMATARTDQTATLLADGRVLVTGGLGASGYLASAELYDPATGKFGRTGSMAGTRNGQTATLLADGRVLIAGGFRGHTDPTIIDVPETLSSAELYDPTTGTFHPTGSMTAARGGHTATLLSDGRVLVAGGSVASMALGDNTSGSAELYDAATGTFSPTGSMAHHRSGQTATLLSDGRVLIAGGRGRNMSGDFTLASAELYDPLSGTFSSTGSMTVPGEGQTATPLHDGRVLVAGDTNDSAELYDPRTGGFTATGPMTTSRFAYAAALLADGRVLLTGGNVPTSNSILASAELFEP